MGLKKISDKTGSCNTSICTLGIMNDTSLVSVSQGCHVGVQQVLKKICPTLQKWMNVPVYRSADKENANLLLQACI